VDGGNVIINSVGDLEAVNVNNDIKVGKGRQLNKDLDMDRAVIKFITDECGKSFKISGEDIVPSMDMKLDLGMLFKVPGGSESNPFKNRTRSFGGTSHSAHRLTVNIDNAEFRHGRESVLNSLGEHANMLTKLTVIGCGSGTVIKP